ncbi:hypothetical protein [Deinococcus sp.]|uniref:hypothetical protein n=1 Tax=Deinococcus sp. TaxID=47478 RepID=UPI003CC620D5
MPQSQHTQPDTRKPGQPDPPPAIVISGVDEPEPGEHNLSPTEEAAERMKLQHGREDPEDEDG